MLNNFLSKSSPLIGKYFRPVALIFLAFGLMGAAGFIFSDNISKVLNFELNSVKSLWLCFIALFGTASLLWSSFIALILFSFGLCSLYAIIRPREESYEAWGAGFYLAVLVAIVYYFLKLVGIDL